MGAAVGVGGKDVVICEYTEKTAVEMDRISERQWGKMETTGTKVRLGGKGERSKKERQALRSVEEHAAWLKMMR